MKLLIAFYTRPTLIGVGVASSLQELATIVPRQIAMRNLPLGGTVFVQEVAQSGGAWRIGGELFAPPEFNQAADEGLPPDQLTTENDT